MRILHGSMDLSILVHRSKCITFVVNGRSERKEKIMFGYFTKIASKLKVPSVQDREMAYLNGSVDRVDLEYRQRQIDRGMFRGRGNGIL